MGTSTLGWDQGKAGRIIALNAAPYTYICMYIRILHGMDTKSGAMYFLVIINGYLLQK